MADSYCPFCGAEISASAKGCRECGSDERTGWKSREELDLHAVDLPEDEDYQDFLEKEGLARRRRGRSGRPKLWIVVTGILLLGALVFSFVLL